MSKNGTAPEPTLNAASGFLTDSAALTFSDVDTTDVVTVSSVYKGDAVWSGGSLTAQQLAAITGGLSVNNNSWNYSVANAAVQFLGAGEMITLSFTVTATDDSGTSNNSDSEIVTITISGTNDGPVISVQAGDTDQAALTEGNAGVTVSGKLTISDTDTNDVVDVAVTGVTVGGTGNAGSLTSAQLQEMLSLTGAQDNAADGAKGSLGWTFNSGSDAFNNLAAGETLILTYTLTATDTAGASDAQTVSVTITGKWCVREDLRGRHRCGGTTSFSITSLTATTLAGGVAVDSQAISPSRRPGCSARLLSMKTACTR